jgi:hypothetical protein
MDHSFGQRPPFTLGVDPTTQRPMDHSFGQHPRFTLGIDPTA